MSVSAFTQAILKVPLLCACCRYSCWAHVVGCRAGKSRSASPFDGGYRAGKSTWENAARFAYDVYEGFQRKEQTLAVAVDLEDSYNRVQFKLLLELLRQYGASLTLTIWLAAALQESTESGSPRPNNWQLDFHNAPLCPLSSTMSTQRDWRIWTAMV